MSNTLNDRLKNEYSTKYVLVTDSELLYPRFAGIDPNQLSEKIQQSRVDVLPTEGRSKLDPFRQAAGRFYTVKGSSPDVKVVEFESFVGGFESPSEKVTLLPAPAEGQPEYKIEDVTQQWSEFFQDGVYKDTLNLTRKATRVKILYNTDDLLKNRLLTLSLLTDIYRKNQEKAYNYLGTSNLVNPLQDESVADELSMLAFAAAALNDAQKEHAKMIEINKKILQLSLSVGVGTMVGNTSMYWAGPLGGGDGPTKSDQLQSLQEKEDDPTTVFPYDHPPGYTNIVIKTMDIFPTGIGGAGPTWDQFASVGISETEKALAEIDAQGIAVQEAKDNLDAAVAETIAQVDEDEVAYISFPTVLGSNYNCNSVVTKNNLNMSYAGLANVPLTSLDFNNQAGYIPEWEGFSLNALKQAIESGHLRAFINPNTKQYFNSTNLLYRDEYFSMPLPMSPKALSLTNDLNKNELYVEFKPRYNYYSKMYEEGTKQQSFIDLYGDTKNLTELELPMIYEVPLDEDPDGTPSSDIEIQFIGGTSSKFKFEKFGHRLLNCKHDTDPFENRGYYNIIIDQNSQQFLKKYDNVKTQFPFYIDINFKADSNKDFATIFNQSGISSDLIKTWISNFFHTNTVGTDISINPDKTDPITKNGGTGGGALIGSGYYNPEDSDSNYNEVLPGTFQAQICKELIYQIKSKKDFYLVVPPEVSEDSHFLEGISVRETPYDYNVREFDLNLWLEGYMKSLVAESSSQPNQTSPGGIQYGASWNNKVIRSSEASIVTKVFSSSDDEGYSSPDTLLEKTIKSLAFLAKYRNLVDEKSRNYDEIIKGEKAYNETLFYRIQKVAVNDDGSTDENGLVQNIWLVKPNAKQNETNVDVMRYIDTQVKYEQNYEYTVYAYQLVLGSRYGFQIENYYPGSNDAKVAAYEEGVSISAQNEGYEAATTATGNGNEFLYQNGLGYESFNVLFKNVSSPSQFSKRMFLFDVVCEPHVKLVEVPFYKKEVVINDAPPAPPELDIVPLRGRDNDIKINFYPGSVASEMVPIIMKPQDYPKFGKARKSQDRALFKIQFAPFTALGEDGLVTLSQTAEDYLSELAGVDLDLASLPPEFYVEEKLQFRSDDFATHYEVYRLDEKPETIVDFSDSLLTIIDALKVSSFTDTIEQNRKYYYMFRTIDVHNNVSNPSPIYQVEMVENSGAVYPVISIYEFENPSFGSKTKSFRKRLKIDAEALQAALNLEESNLADADSAIESGGDGNLTLGLKDKKIFTDSKQDFVKRYKFRIRSKHTGKILDLNVAFKLNEIEPTEAIIPCGDGVTIGALEVQTGEIVGEFGGVGTEDSESKIINNLLI